MVDEQIGYFRNNDVMYLEGEINDFISSRKGRSLLSIQFNTIKTDTEHYYEALIVYRDMSQTDVYALDKWKEKNK